MERLQEIYVDQGEIHSRLIIGSGSTFLIPIQHVGRLRRLLVYHDCNLRTLVAILLHQYRKRIRDILPPRRKLKLQYQATDQDFQRVHFRPFHDDWFELMMISRVSGFSCCYIFTLLMDLHEADIHATREADNVAFAGFLSRDVPAHVRATLEFFPVMQVYRMKMQIWARRNPPGFPG